MLKATKKNRTKEEVDLVIYWLTGYNQKDMTCLLSHEVTIEQFFHEAPHLNEKRHQITGLICGVRIEEIEDPLMKEIRYLDKLIDELAKGKTLDKILNR